MNTGLLNTVGLNSTGFAGATTGAGGGGGELGGVVDMLALSLPGEDVLAGCDPFALEGRRSEILNLCSAAGAGTVSGAVGGANMGAGVGLVEGARGTSTSSWASFADLVDSAMLTSPLVSLLR